jgi:MFS family permease
MSLSTASAQRPEPTALGLLVAGRGLRGLVDGLVSVILAIDLTRRGFSELEVGAIITTTLLGSALLTLAVGMGSRRLEARTVLGFAPLLMLGTGLGFAGLESLPLLLCVAFIGTLNPSGGDVSIFLPAEQALLAAEAPPERRTAVFGRYALAGSLCAALGTLASGLPARVGAWLGWSHERQLAPAYLAYAAVGVLLLVLYAPLRRRAPHVAASAVAGAAPVRVRPVVWRLAALFCLDSLGGGFVVQSLFALWLLSRFGLTLETTGLVFFVAGLLSAFSQLVSAPLARRIGLVRTMVFTHIPANLFLMATALAPSAPVAIALIFARFALSSMDVPARQALVMGLVPPEERPAAASITNVPRSLAAAVSPFIAGALLQSGDFRWALVLGGGLKITYDLLLFAQSRALAASERGAAEPHAPERTASG